MRRTMLAVGMSAALLMAASALYGQSPTYTRDEERTRRYVLVEKTGDEVTCNVYGSVNEVKERIDNIRMENKRIQKANRPLKPELKKLRTQLAAKERKLKGAKDGPDKDALEKEIASLKTQITNTKAQIKPVTKYLPYKRFSKAEAAQKYIDEITAAAARARAKADRKRRKEAEKEDK